MERYYAQIHQTVPFDDDKALNYQNTLRQNIAAMSAPLTRTLPTELRLDNVKELIRRYTIEPMANYDNMCTETATDIDMNKKIVDIKAFFAHLDLQLEYIKSGSTGHAFKATSRTNRNIQLVVKVAAYQTIGYGGIHNMSRPENAELRMVKLLSYFVLKKYTPHFVLPLCTSYACIKDFIDITSNVVDIDNPRNSQYKLFLERYEAKKFDNLVSVFIGEWCNGGDLIDYLRRNHQSLTLIDWQTIMFQILFTLAMVHQKYPSFRHNDAKGNNMLVNITNDKALHPNYKNTYKMGRIKFVIPVSNISIKIWDFDFASIKGIIDNDKTDSLWAEKHAIGVEKNRYYDVHYFLNTLSTFRFFPQFYQGGAPQEVLDFVHRVVPKQYRKDPRYVSDKGRLLVQHEYLTPHEIIMKDTFFDAFRFTI